MQYIVKDNTLAREQVQSIIQNRQHTISNKE
jgi:hypothetical protein